MDMSEHRLPLEGIRVVGGSMPAIGSGACAIHILSV
jgi:hypothetical protein